MVIQNRVPAGDWSAGGKDSEAARCLKFPPKSRAAEEDPKLRDPAFYDARTFLSICNGDYVGTPCPQRARCGLMALINNDEVGVFGGWTTPQRKWIRQTVARTRWNDDAYLRTIVPAPDTFKNFGDDEEEEDGSTPDEA